MAVMKRLWLPTLLALIIGALMIERIVRTEPDDRAAATIPVKLTIAPLASDPKEARKTVEQQRQALQKLAPKKPYIVIDRYANRLTLRTSDSVLLSARCSTGSGAVLDDSTTGRQWVFETPGGVFKVTSKLHEPWWRKPDWAYIEENEPIPRNNSERLDNEMLGEFALGFGDGFFIHGTLYERLLGINVTHGCVRLGADDLKQLYERVLIGTLIYIY